MPEAFNPMDGQTSKKRKKQWEKSEEETEDIMGGSQQIGSGSKPPYKGDVSADETLTEVKSTKNKGLYLQRGWLKKITKEAHGDGKTPRLVVDFRNMPTPYPKKWVMMPAREYEAVVEEKD